jgi:hypothetical protein
MRNANRRMCGAMMLRFVSRSTTTLVSVAITCTAACGSSGDGGADAAGPSVACLEANSHSDLSWIQDNVFTPSCSKFGACHKDAALSAAGLNLEAGKSRASLVGVKSKLFPQFDLVAAGNASNSYLMIIAGHYPGYLKAGVGTMPLNSPVLCVEKRQAIDRWISAGALP